MPSPFTSGPACCITKRMAESSSRAPLIALRIPRELDERLRAHVDETGSTISDVVRGAIERDLAGSSPTPRADTAAKITAGTIGKRPKRAAVSRCEHRVTSGAFCAKCDGIVP